MCLGQIGQAQCLHLLSRQSALAATRQSTTYAAVTLPCAHCQQLQVSLLSSWGWWQLCLPGSASPADKLPKLMKETVDVGFLQGAGAIADVLFGKVSPSGRLPVTFYHSNYTLLVKSASMDMAAWPGRTHRYLQEPPLYPFGHGLSYSTFEYGSLELIPAHSRDDGAALLQTSICNAGWPCNGHTI